jgi:hypothetical protein
MILSYIVEMGRELLFARSETSFLIMDIIIIIIIIIIITNSCCDCTRGVGW